MNLHSSQNIKIRPLIRNVNYDAFFKLKNRVRRELQEEKVLGIFCYSKKKWTQQQTTKIILNRDLCSLCLFYERKETCSSAHVQALPLLPRRPPVSVSQLLCSQRRHLAHLLSFLPLTLLSASALRSHRAPNLDFPYPIQNLSDTKLNADVTILSFSPWNSQYHSADKNLLP